MARLDSAILHEIVHVIQSREKVPDRIRILKRQFQISYLEDHRQRMEEALRRRDFERLNMLYGQLASKVKYQVIRAVAVKSSSSNGSRATAAKKPAERDSKRRPVAKRQAASKAAPAKKSAAKKTARARAR